MSNTATCEDRDFCWACGEALLKADVLCTACHKIQPLRDINAFERFGFEPHFVLDEKILEKTYLNLQKKLHPDRFVKGSEQEKSFSVAQSAAVNSAYALLKDPLKRAECLLTLYGFFALKPVNAQESEILAEVLDIREALDEAEALICVTQITNQVRHLYQEDMAKLEQSFEAQDLNQAFLYFQRLKYISKIMEECSLKLARLV